LEEPASPLGSTWIGGSSHDVEMEDFGIYLETSINNSRLDRITESYTVGDGPQISVTLTSKIQNPSSGLEQAEEMFDNC
jgi:hypothetical protein